MKKLRVLSICLVITVLFVCISNISFAAVTTYDASGTETKTPVIDTESFKPGNLTTSDFGDASKLARNIVGALRTVGVVVAFVGLMFLGIKYMTGSIEQKAEYKKTMIPFVVGFILIFAVPMLLSIIYNIVSTAEGQI